MNDYETAARHREAVDEWHGLIPPYDVEPDDEPDPDDPHSWPEGSLGRRLAEERNRPRRFWDDNRQVWRDVQGNIIQPKDELG